MKRVKCRFTYEAVVWMTDSEYEKTQEKSDMGEVEKEIKNMLYKNLLSEKGRKESSKIRSFYFGMDEEWK